MNNILKFPSSTIYDRPMPKNSFWQKADNPTALKDSLTREFESITCLYKLNCNTLNVEDGKNVHEIIVLHCRMKGDSYSLNPLCAMDKLLPRHTLFIIEYGESIDIIMQYKEKVGDKWRIGETEMLRNAELSNINCPLSIVGNTLDAIYINLLNQVSALNANDNTTYKEQVELRKQIETLTKQINILQNNIRKEKQFNRQIEMNGEARALKKLLAELKKKAQGDL